MKMPFNFPGSAGDKAEQRLQAPDENQRIATHRSPHPGRAPLTESLWLGLLGRFEPRGHVHGSTHTSPHGSTAGNTQAMPWCQGETMWSCSRGGNRAAGRDRPITTGEQPVLRIGLNQWPPRRHRSTQTPNLNGGGEEWPLAGDQWALQTSQGLPRISARDPGRGALKPDTE